MAETSPYKDTVESIRSWPLSRKLALAGVGLLSIVLFAIIIFQTGRADYRPLYTDLPRDEAAEITDKLKEREIPYELENNGRSIYVPAASVHETRLELAGEGLPKQGGAGFEIFDEQNFGQTKFTQKVNYQRAMQGELARTVAALETVESARVHLVLPEDRLLQQQQKPAKASVVVDLSGGGSLDSSQTRAISHMVAGAIEGLDKNMVTIIDTSGRTLSGENDSDPASQMLPDKLKFKNTLETRLEDRVQSLLDNSLGPGNSVVRITTDIDFSSEDVTTEEFDPDTLVPRSEEITESTSGRTQEGGEPGTEANLGDGEETGAEESETRSSEIVNYEISKTVRQTQRPAGDVENISAAVMVADEYDPEANEGEGGYTPVPPEKLDSIQTMVASAIGLDSERGDRVEVVSMPFEKETFEQAPAETGPALYEYLPYAKYLVLAICALLVYFALIRPMIKTLGGQTGWSGGGRAPELAYEYESGSGAGELDAPAKLKKELDHYSVTPAQVVKTWLKEG